MSTFVVEELKTTLSQTVNVKNNNRKTIAGFKALLYLHNDPAGTFTLKLKLGSDTILSDSFTTSEVKTNLSTSDSYIKIWQPAIAIDPVHIDRGTYTIELSSSGYSFSESSFIGWIKEHENLYNETEGGDPASDADNPLSFRLFEKFRPEFIK